MFDGFPVCLETVIGIDPGLTGAVAPSTAYASTVIDMPVERKDGKPTVKNQVDGAALADILKPYNPERTLVCLEKASSMPPAKGKKRQSGGSSMMSIGDTYGAIRTVIAVLGFPVIHVHPATWKTALGLRGAGKNASRQLACKLFPDLVEYLSRVKDHDRAEALLLSVYARLQFSAKFYK